MAKRVVIAGILGGLVMFCWLFVAHEFLPLGEMGVGEIPNEGPVLSAMQGALSQPGFYIHPGFGLGPNATTAQRNAAMPAYMKKYEQSPHGILIYNPPSGPFNFGKLLAREGTLNRRMSSTGIGTNFRARTSQATSLRRSLDIP